MERGPEDLSAASDYVIDQGWDDYGESEHAIWRRLFERQAALLPGRACEAYLTGLDKLAMVADGIPEFEKLSDLLEAATGWRLVAVPGLVPDDVFFYLLANRRFPTTNWIRRPAQLDYLQEPDVFHDLFGHVPLLTNPVFADYLQAYGKGGLKALRLGALPKLARLYWYTVEFGLIATPAGLRIYGAGILSSFDESRYCLESEVPKRLPFDPTRIMRTRYRIDDLQDVYFVIESFEQLFEATRPDFTAHYRYLAHQADIDPGDLLPGETTFDIAA